MPTMFHVSSTLNRAVDVWQVEGVDADVLLDNANGFYYVPGSISVDRISIAQRDLLGGGMFGPR